MPPSPRHEALRCPDDLFGGGVGSRVQKVKRRADPQVSVADVKHVLSHEFVGLTAPGDYA